MHTRLIRRAGRHRWQRGVLVFTMLMVGVACGEPSSRSPSAAAEDVLPSAGAAEWVLPVEGLEWHRTRLLAVFAFPLDSDAAAVRVEVNGHDQTERFSTVGLYSRRWSERTASGLDQGAAGPAPGAGDRKRVQAVLHPGDLVEGENRLRAIWTDASGHERRSERRFRWTPGERLIRCIVTRTTSRGEDDRAGARIVIESLDDSPLPDLSAGSSHPLHPWPAARRRAFALARDGQASFYLPAGRYRAIATGGLLDSIESWTIPATGDAMHTFRLMREIELPGTTTVDFHVHAAPSSDSLVPLDERLYSFLAAGVDVIVASDHSDVTDYQPLLASLPGALGRITALAGVEVALRRRDGPGSFGHWNVWPLQPDPFAPPVRLGQVSGHGALPAPTVDDAAEVRNGRGVAAMFDAYRRQARDLRHRRQQREGGEAAAEKAERLVIQLNHPRGIPHKASPGGVSPLHDWFTRAGFDAAARPSSDLLAATTAGTTAFDFDALEIWNRSSRRLYRHVRRDWFSLLNQGYRPTGTANTDTHTIAPELAGFPLNVVFLPAGAADGARVAESTLAAAVHAGRVIGTDGPIPLLSVHAGGESAGPGEGLTASDGLVEIRVDVRAASWVPVGEVRVWINGALRARGSAAVSGESATFVLRTTLVRDAWIVAEVGDLDGIAEGTVVSGMYGRLVPRGLALGFTNPVWVDADGSGTFDAPGLQHGHLPPAE